MTGLSLGDVASAGILAGLLVVLYVRRRVIFVASILLLFQMVWNTISVGYIEMKSPLLLVSTWSFSHDIGAFTAICNLYSAFVIGMLTVPAPSWPSNVAVDVSSAPRMAEIYARRVCLTAIFLLLVNALASPNLLSNSDINRANFYDTAVVPFASQINIALPAMLATVSYCGFCSSNSGRAGQISGIVALVMSGTSAFLTGTQFSGYLVICVSFLTPILLVGSKKVSRKAASRTVIALVASGLAAAGYKASTFADSTDYTGVADSGFDRFMYRAFALQGEVFWKTALLFGDSPQPNQMRNEFLVFSHRLPDTRSGIYTLMENLVPNYKGGPLFTLNAGYPAILVYIFGFGVFSLLACVVSGILFAAVVRLFVAELWRGSVVGIFGSYGLLYAIYLAFTMGGALYLGSWAAIASGALLVALYAWRHLTQTVPVHGETRSTVPSVDDPLAFETVDDRSGSFSAHPDNQ